MRGDFVMMIGKSRKNGFTLVEVLVVVIIMGILSSMGVASITGAVANARVKDYAQNTAAFLERMANDANRMSKTLCINVQQKSIDVYSTSDCSGSIYAQYSLELQHPVKFGCDIDNDLSIIDSKGAMSGDHNWGIGGAGHYVLFEPRIGLSAVPRGFLCLQYGNSNTYTDNAYGIAVKYSDKNMVKPKWTPSGSNDIENWLDL